MRIEAEDSYLNFRSPGYVVARFIEATVPKGEKVLALSPVFEAYTTREILIGYQAASNRTLTDVLWTAMIEDFRPTWRLKFHFPARQLRKVRVIQTATAEADIWSVSEMEKLFRRKFRFTPLMTGESVNCAGSCDTSVIPAAM